MYCYSKKNCKKPMKDSLLRITRTPNGISFAIQLKEATENRRKEVPVITSFIHEQNPHEGFTHQLVQNLINGSVGWDLPFAPSWGRFYKYHVLKPGENPQIISFSVSGNTATIHHAGPFGKDTTAQL